MLSSLEAHHPLASAPTHLTFSGLNQLLDLLPDAMVVVNQEGTMVMVSQQAEAAFGYTRFRTAGSATSENPASLNVSVGSYHPSGAVISPHHALVRWAIGLPLVWRKKDGSEFPVDI